MGQYLPIEVIEEIVYQMELRELLQMRLMSRRWNSFVTAHLPNSRLPIIKFYKGQEDYFSNYLLTLQTRLEKGVAFGSYQLYLGDWTKVESFLSVIGTYMRHCTLYIRDTLEAAQLYSLLAHMPNLKEFYFEGPKCFLSLFSQISTNNTKLQKLSIKTCSKLDQDCFTIERLMANLTGLKILNIDSVTRFSSQTEFYALLNRHPNLKSLSLSIKFDDFQDVASVDEYHINPDLKLNLSVTGLNGNNISTLIGSLNVALRSLSFKLVELTEDINILRAANLKRLQLTMNNVENLDKFWNKNTPSNFLALKSITLTFNGIDYSLVKPHSRKVSFPTVTSLTVDGGFDALGNGVKPYHIIFPNLTTFRMRGIILACHVAYIDKFLPNVTHLSLISISETSNLHTALFPSTTKDQLGNFAPPRLEFVCKWGLSSLFGLKRLHITDMKHIGKTILGIAALTHLKQLSSMQYLKFTGKLLGNREQLLFHNCAHQKVVFEHKMD